MNLFEVGQSVRVRDDSPSSTRGRTAIVKRVVRKKHPDSPCVLITLDAPIDPATPDECRDWHMRPSELEVVREK